MRKPDAPWIVLAFGVFLIYGFAYSIVSGNFGSALVCLIGLFKPYIIFISWRADVRNYEKRLKR